MNLYQYIPLIFLILFVLGMLIFLFESTIAPIVRKAIEFKLFALRDLLRGINKCEKNNEAILILDNSICHIISNSESLTFSYRTEVNKIYNTDLEFKKEVIVLKSIIQNSSKEIREIETAVSKYIFYLFFINSGMRIFFYIIPAILAITSFDSVKSILVSIANSFSEGNDTFMYNNTNSKFVVN